MRPPRLNRQMVLQAPLRVLDGMGGFSQNWQDLGHHWVALKPGAGRQTLGEEQRLGEVSYRITLRAAPLGTTARPKAGQRLIEGARCFVIRAVSEADAQGLYLTCHCHEEEPQ